MLKVLKERERVVVCSIVRVCTECRLSWKSVEDERPPACVFESVRVLPTSSFLKSEFALNEDLFTHVFALGNTAVFKLGNYLNYQIL